MCVYVCACVYVCVDGKKRTLSFLFCWGVGRAKLAFLFVQVAGAIVIGMGDLRSHGLTHKITSSIKGVEVEMRGGVVLLWGSCLGVTMAGLSQDVWYRGDVVGVGGGREGCAHFIRLEKDCTCVCDHILQHVDHAIVPT